MKIRCLIFAAIVLFAFSSVARADDNPHSNVNGADNNKQIYLFSYFNENHGPGDGLHLAWSDDGYKWTALNGDRILFKPMTGPVFRDPFVMLCPDGIFRMVWTDGWDGKHIGYAESRDLMHWTNEKAIPVMANEPKSRNCWAPEMFYDVGNKQYMIFWSSTIPGHFPETDKSGDKGFNHRIYYTTTTDFKKFAVAKLLYDPGFNCIDATIIFGLNRYVMFLKDETLSPPKKFIVLAISKNLEGPYSPTSKALTMSWAEGPTVIRIGDKWDLYYDNYTLHTFGLSQSSDLKHWTIATAKLKMPAGVRHGTAIAVPYDIFDKLPK